jgi:hypothetical protein
MKLFNHEIRKPNKGTALHPDYKKAIEFAFEIQGIEYFQFKNLADMPSERYYAVSERITEVEMRIDRESLLAYLDKIEELINLGNFGRVGAIVEEMRFRTEMLVETETLYRLASCVFFTIDEDLTTYDLDFNDAKIAIFKKEKINDFFFKEPIKKFIRLPSISQQDLELCLKLTEARKKYQNYLLT